MKKSTILKSIAATAFLVSSIHAYSDNNSADESFFAGSFQTVIDTNPQPLSNLNNSFNIESITNTKIISLMRLSPTAEIIARAERIERMAADDDEADESDEIKAITKKEIIAFDKSETAKDLTMNNVPVLDQGQHGTCVTFATTAALDALLEQGDFIDQQCTLAHSFFLGNNYWEGARQAAEIITPLKTHGIVEQGKCTDKYPAPSVKINTEDYTALVNADVTIETVESSYNRNLKLQDIRNSIDNGKRIALGFMVKANSDPISVRGFDTVIDGKTNKGGLWACKLEGNSKNYCGFAFAGHEVVVVGYDDGQELLKIRNSWGNSVGDNGDYYMSYDFFNAMSLDGTSIGIKAAEADAETDTE